jgi:hypothetical protein
LGVINPRPNHYPLAYSDCQKFFPIAYLMVGARRAVPSSLWAWLAMPLRTIIFGNRYKSKFKASKLSAFKPIPG